ncbi:PREDICTED: dual specificity protein phosphatase 3-like [Eufriesea mexicana]|uniref:dual specificity protein phosphatase 3-like n=1 Tax=Eufriesea mexicana TaxID=516756 RepID=UPI00083C7C26|nr:PREDICTED: dual specificity protein phosphatase 3-like [Eufriesea mexicana]
MECDFQEKLSNDEITKTYNKLKEVLNERNVRSYPKVSTQPNSLRELDYDEVYPSIYIGNAATARNKAHLLHLGITHLLNAAEGKEFGCVNTNASYYSDTTIKYLGLQLVDCDSTDISRYFHIIQDFIDEAISARGKVFVHCVLGISRSATCVLAYLMLKKGKSAAEAIQLVRRNRFIQPNCGFLRQLAVLDNQLQSLRK